MAQLASRSRRDAVWAGCRLAYGEDLMPVYHVEQADVIVALRRGLPVAGPDKLNDVRGFGTRREVGDGNRSRNDEPPLRHRACC